MMEFIEELKHNQNVNVKNNLENRINIDYVIERLENIQHFLISNMYYFRYHNKNLTRQQDEKLTFIYDNLVSKGVFKNEK